MQFRRTVVGLAVTLTAVAAVFTGASTASAASAAVRKSVPANSQVCPTARNLNCTISDPVPVAGDFNCYVHSGFFMTGRYGTSEVWLHGVIHLAAPRGNYTAYVAYAQVGPVPGLPLC